MPGKYDFTEARKLANEQLAGEIAKLTPLTVPEVQKLLPTKVDKERFTKIIEIVNGAAAQNTKIANLRKNFTELGGVVLKLLSKYLKPV